MTIKVDDEHQVVASFCFYKHCCNECICLYYLPLPIHVSVSVEQNFRSVVVGAQVYILNFKILPSSHINIYDIWNMCRNNKWKKTWVCKLCQKGLCSISMQKRKTHKNKSEKTLHRNKSPKTIYLSMRSDFLWVISILCYNGFHTLFSVFYTKYEFLF